MPFVHILMIEGRPEEVKRALIEKVTDAVVDAGCGPPEGIRVVIQEVPSTQWGIGGKPAKDLGR